MKKLLSLVCILTAIAYQPAQARSYNYEFAGQGAHDYVIIEGERYARIPPKAAPRGRQFRVAERVQETSSQKSSDYKQPQKYYLDEMAVFDTKPYIGLDFLVSRAKLSNKNEDRAIFKNDIFKNEFNSFGAVVGAKLNPYIGIEAFYQRSLDAKKSDTPMAGEFATAATNTLLSYSAYGMDALLYVPMTQKLELLFSLGYAYYDFDISNKVTITSTSIDISDSRTSKKSHDTGAVRMGIGLQYPMTENLYLRMMARYINFGDSEYFKKMREFSLGVRYMF